MKKISLLLIITVFSLAGFAQLSIGLQGTGSLADARVKSVEDLDYRKKMKAMAGAGVVLQYGFSKHFAIRSGVNYAQNGVIVSTAYTDGSGIKVKLESRLHYVQVPVNLLYTLPLSRIQLYAGGGGYVNYGFDGNIKSTLNYTGADGQPRTTVENSDAFKKEADGGSGFKRTDFGIGALGGIRVGRVFVNAGYQLSLSNLDSGEEKDEYKNRSLQFTIGYFFR